MRFRSTPPDLNRLTTLYSPNFTFHILPQKTDRGDLTITKDTRDQIRVIADSLNAHLSPFRAILYQKTPRPFTQRDLYLRNLIIREYDMEKPDPGFPLVGGGEPSFEVE